MDKFDIQKLRALPIESVAARLALRVIRHKALCPFHADSHPSLTFHRATNTYKCFVCGAHGDTIDLTMHLLPGTCAELGRSKGRTGGVSFIESCRWLADEHNIIMTTTPQAAPTHLGGRGESRPPDTEYLARYFRQPILNADAQRFLFAERKIDPRVVHWLGITSISSSAPCWRYGKPYFDAPALLFPYRDADGNLLNVQSRYLGKVQGPPRFRFPSGSQCHIFGLPILKLLRPGEPLYLSEGISDCMALLSAGHKTIAIPSATLLKAEDLLPIQQLAASYPKETPMQLHIYPDRDQAGEQLYQLLAYYAAQIGCLLVRHDLPPEFKDFGDYWAATRSSTQS